MKEIGTIETLKQELAAARAEVERLENDLDIGRGVNMAIRNTIKIYYEKWCNNEITPIQFMNFIIRLLSDYEPEDPRITKAFAIISSPPKIDMTGVCDVLGGCRDCQYGECTYKLKKQLEMVRGVLEGKQHNFEIPDDGEKEVPEISTTTTQVIQMNDGRMYLDVTDYIQTNPAPMDWVTSENLHCFNTLTGNTCSCNRCKGYDPKIHPNPEKGGETHD
jgi:hypothetical protein